MGAVRGMEWIISRRLKRGTHASINARRCHLNDDPDEDEQHAEAEALLDAIQNRHSEPLYDQSYAAQVWSDYYGGVL